MKRTKYGYAESSDIKSTNAGHLYHIINDELAIENGTLWKKGAVSKIEQTEEVYNVTKPAKGDEVMLALSVLIPYDTTTTLGSHEMFLRKEAGEIARGYELVKDDRFAVADYMITPLSEKVVKGNIVVADTSTGKYTEKTSGEDLATYGFAARINNIEYKGSLTIVRLEVIKNETVAGA